MASRSRRRRNNGRPQPSSPPSPPRPPSSPLSPPSFPAPGSSRRRNDGRPQPSSPPSPPRPPSRRDEAALLTSAPQPPPMTWHSLRPSPPRPPSRRDDAALLTSAPPPPPMTWHSLRPSPPHTPPPSPPPGSSRRDDETLLTSAPPPPPMPWRSLRPSRPLSPPPFLPPGSSRRDDATLLTSAPPPPPMPWRSLRPSPPLPPPPFLPPGSSRRDDATLLISAPPPPPMPWSSLRPSPPLPPPPFPPPGSSRRDDATLLTSAPPPPPMPSRSAPPPPPMPSRSLRPSPPLPPPPFPPPGSSRRDDATLLTSAPPPPPMPSRSAPPPPPMPSRSLRPSPPLPPPPFPPPGSSRRDDATLLTSAPPPPPMPSRSAPPPPPMPSRSLRPSPPPPMPQHSRLHMATWRKQREERETQVKTSSSSILQATEHMERERDSLTTTLQESTASSSSVTQTRASDVSLLRPTGLLIKYFLRVDKERLFHIYPGRGGPFESSKEAQEFIDSYHVVERQNLCMDGLSAEERSVRCALYWHHDGTRKNSAEAFAAMASRRPIKEVVEALLDKYNEDNSRFGDSAYKLKDIVSYQPCFDGQGCTYRSYSHLNMTMKTRGEESKLFFAEVTCMVDEDEKYVLTCICAVAPDDNGECLVCEDKVKHPSDAVYKLGRFKPRVRCCSGADAQDLYDEHVTVHDEAWLKLQEAKVRQMFKKAHEAIKADFLGDDGHGKDAKPLNVPRDLLRLTPM